MLEVVLTAGDGVARQRELAEELWPDLDGDAARNALDLALHMLRKLLSRGHFLADEDAPWTRTAVPQVRPRQLAAYGLSRA